MKVKHTVQSTVYILKYSSQDVLGKTLLPPHCFHCGPLPEAREPH